MRLPLNVLIVLLLLAAPVFGAGIPERPANYVTDSAGVIEDRSEAQLNAILRELEQKTTAQALVLTVDTTGDLPITAFALQVVEKWQIGQRGKDNGFLLVLAIKDRKYRFEVGYGLESILPDSLVGSIGRDRMAPYFKQGDISGGVMDAMLFVAGIIAKDSSIQLSGLPQAQGRTAGARVRGKPSLLSKIFTVLIFIAFIYMFIRYPRMMIMMLLLSGMGGRRSHWGGGGGFGGGGGGGFGGGGAGGGW